LIFFASVAVSSIAIECGAVEEHAIAAVIAESVVNPVLVV